MSYEQQAIISKVQETGKGGELVAQPRTALVTIGVGLAYLTHEYARPTDL